MNKRGSNGRGSGRVSGVTNTTEVANMVVKGTGDGRGYLLGEIDGEVKDETDI